MSCDIRIRKADKWKDKIKISRLTHEDIEWWGCGIEDWFRQLEQIDGEDKKY